MLKNLSFFINCLNFFKLKCERDEFGFYGSIQLQYKGKKFVDRINGKDIYECFVKLSLFTSQILNYDEFRKKYYSLCTIDKLEITNYGPCFAASKAKRLIYKERYDYHCSLEKYFEELQNQITNFQDFSKPIFKLENYEQL